MKRPRTEDEMSSSRPVSVPAKRQRQRVLLTDHHTPLHPPPAPAVLSPNNVFVLEDEFKGVWQFFINAAGVVVPVKPPPPPPPTSIDLVVGQRDGWHCKVCTLVNSSWNHRCSLCDSLPCFVPKCMTNLPCMGIVPWPTPTTMMCTTTGTKMPRWDCTFCGAEQNAPQRVTCRLCQYPQQTHVRAAAPQPQQQQQSSPNSSTTTPSVVSSVVVVAPAVAARRLPSPSLWLTTTTNPGSTTTSSTQQTINNAVLHLNSNEDQGPGLDSNDTRMLLWELPD